MKLVLEEVEGLNVHIGSDASIINCLPRQCEKNFLICYCFFLHTQLRLQKIKYRSCLYLRVPTVVNRLYVYVFYVRGFVYYTDLKYILNCTVHTSRCIVCTVPFNRVRTFVNGTQATVALMYKLLQFRLVWYVLHAMWSCSMYSLIQTPL